MDYEDSGKVTFLGTDKRTDVSILLYQKSCQKKKCLHQFLLKNKAQQNLTHVSSFMSENVLPLNKHPQVSEKKQNKHHHPQKHRTKPTPPPKTLQAT